MWIPMADGTRLSARVWRPADGRPVPAILEYIPYRKRDMTSTRDSIMHPYVAGHGYACVRVDLRGSGDSEGILTDEYLVEELADGEDVVAWIADQPWCDGSVGMIGISWGGFNALQIAARRPPALRAAVTVCSTDDRYADDVHYMGGCLLGDNLSWASVMFAYNSSPPDPEVVGDRWRQMWLERLENSGLWVDTWLRHQRRDSYWQHGSVIEDYEAIQCPVMAVSGWADGYSNAVFRLLAGLTVPRLGLIGPWSHKYPHMGEPGPAIGFLQEVVRWWDRWLKGIDNGVMDAPMLRVWMQDSVPPSTSYETRPGRWVGEPSWPSPNVRRHTMRLAPGRICQASEEVEEGALTISSPLSVGQFAGKWCSYNAPPDLPYDQREDDGGSLVFDTVPLTEPWELVGTPVVELDVAVDRPVAMIAVRLSDVAPDGAATRVSYGLLNLAHRDGHGEPRALTPGRRECVRVSLNAMAQMFPAGHRLRVSISTSYFPLAWPPPEPVRMTLFTGTSTVELPLRPKPEREAWMPEFDAPEGAPPLDVEYLEPEDHSWNVVRDLVNHESALEVVQDLGLFRLEAIDLEVGRRIEERYSFIADDFESVRGETEAHMRFRRGDWHVETRTSTLLTCTDTDFRVHAELDAYEGGRRVFSHQWDRLIPRDHV